MKATVVAAAALVLATMLAGCRDEPALHGDVLITADRLFDGRAMRKPGAVLVRGSAIVAVGGSLEADARRRIDLGDATILPGFIDLHVHTRAGNPEGGVTTVRDLGAPISTLRPAGRRFGLRILMAGPLVTVPGGYPTPVWGDSIALDVRTPAAGRRAVRRLAGLGASIVKLALTRGYGDWPILTVPEVRAIVDEAHRHGLRVTAHATGRTGVERALDGGVDELAHAPCGATDDQLRRLVAQRIEVVATLHVLQLAVGGCAEVASRIVELGGELLYGTDAGNAGIPNGIDVAELRLLHEAGLSRDEVLAAATARAGEDLGLEPLGRLVAGAPADVVAVRGDARELRDDLAAPLLVLSGGRIVRDRR